MLYQISFMHMSFFFIHIMQKPCFLLKMSAKIKRDYNAESVTTYLSLVLDSLIYQ